MRRVTLVLGCAAIAVGAWSLARVRTETAACQNESTYRQNFGVGTHCLDQVWFNYLAFGLMLAGLFTAGFALLMMRKHQNIKGIAANASKKLIGTPGMDPDLRDQLRSRFEPSPAPRRRQWRPGYADPPEGPPQDPGS